MRQAYDYWQDQPGYYLTSAQLFWGRSAFVDRNARFVKTAPIIKSEQTLIQGLCVFYLAEAVRQHQLSPSRFIYYLSCPSKESTAKLSWEFMLKKCFGLTITSSQARKDLKRLSLNTSSTWLSRLCITISAQISIQ